MSSNGEAGVSSDAALKFADEPEAGFVGRFPSRPFLVACVCVRDEGDILDTFVAFHLHQGVDFILATDHASIDDTPDILDFYAQRGLLAYCRHDGGPRFQGSWMTTMARRAAHMGASWIINADADEFWMPRLGTLRETFSALSPDVTLLPAFHRNFLPMVGGSGFDPDRQVVWEANVNDAFYAGTLKQKSAHRASPDAIVNEGNHSVSGLVPGHAFGGLLIDIYHYPVRSFEQLEKKIAVRFATPVDANARGLRATRPGAHYQRLNELREADGLRRYYDSQVSKEQIGLGLERGSLIEDHRLSKFLTSARIEGATEFASPQGFEVPRSAASCEPSPALVREVALARRAQQIHTKPYRRELGALRTTVPALPGRLRSASRWAAWGRALGRRQPTGPVPGSSTLRKSGLSGEERMRILVVARGKGFARHLENLMRELLGRGHALTFTYINRPDRSGGNLDDFVRAIGKESASFTVKPVDLIPERRVKLVQAVSLLRDYCWYLDNPTLRDGPHRRRLERALRSSIGRRVSPLLRSSGAVRAVANFTLDRVARHLRTAPVLENVLDDLRPDVVVISPGVILGGLEESLARECHRRRIPTVVVVGSWDNLTTKGRLRGEPDAVIVWNERQAEELVDLHGVSHGIHVVGAHTYDHWFDRRPSRSFEEFTTEVGLGGVERFIVYTCSSRTTARDETTFVDEWLAAVRGCAVGEVSRVGILIRPHPQVPGIWEDWRPSQDSDRVVVWPRERGLPVTDGAKADFFDSLYHASAVVGINTSALWEAAIVGTPVFSIVSPRFSNGQTDTIHFGYLSEGRSDDLLVISHTVGDHVEELKHAILGRSEHADRSRSFIDRNVRPRGRDRRPSSLAADVIEASVGRRGQEATPRRSHVPAGESASIAAGRQPVSAVRSQKHGDSEMTVGLHENTNP